MTNLPLPLSQTLTEDQMTEHRAYIGIKAQAMMGRYFQLPQDDIVKREILLGWMEMLQEYPRSEIDFACKQYLQEFPNSRPHEGKIRAIILKNRGRQVWLQKNKKITPLRRLDK